MFVKNNKLASIASAVSEVMEASPVKIQTPTGTRVLGTRYGNSAKAHHDQVADPFAGHKGPAKKDLEDIEKPKKKQESFSAFTNKLLNNLQEDKKIQKQIDEVLKKDASAGDWIHDFVHSDNPKFAGKSKAERKKMALGAYYAKQNEEADADLDLKNRKDEREETNAIKSIKAKATEKDQKIDNFDPKYGKPNAFGEEVEQQDEALIGNQKKIDKNHNNKIDAQDFKILRGKKKANEEIEQADEAVRVFDISKSAAGVKPKTPEDRNKAAAVVKAARANKPTNNYTGKSIIGAGSVGTGQRQAGQTASHIAVKEEEELDESVTRKHFQQVADLIKTHDNSAKRKELASHHAEIFKQQNPRFDHAKFMKACNVNEETVGETLNPAKKTIDTLAGRSKKVPKDAQMDNGHASAKTELKVEEKDVPFDGPYTKKTPDSIKDKSGATHTPMSRAKHLAQTALKKIKSDLKVK